MQSNSSFAFLYPFRRIRRGPPECSWPQLHRACPLSQCVLSQFVFRVFRVLPDNLFAHLAYFAGLLILYPFGYSVLSMSQLPERSGAVRVLSAAATPGDFLYFRCFFCVLGVFRGPLVRLLLCP